LSLGAVLQDGVKRLVRRAGVDIVRYPDKDPAHARATLLRHLAVDVVFDVGANRGQYGAEVRRYGYAGRLVSFEPLAEPYGRLRRRARRDGAWVAVHAAVGDTEGEAVVNVAANSLSSSLLPMLPAHLAAEPSSVYVGHETAPMVTLDAVFDRYAPGSSHPFLKIDTQGYERQVLTGARASLARITGVQVELSLVPLYEGAMSFEEGLALMRDAGLRVARLDPVLADAGTGRLLQCDGVFVRELGHPSTRVDQ
jgi:FkbM family methyltransferase